MLKQHLIDPEVCIRCNTCEATCPIGAITHDANNYVVDAAICNFCMDCVAPCPTGSIDNWFMVDAPFGVRRSLRGRNCRPGARRRRLMRSTMKPPPCWRRRMRGPGGGRGRR